MIWMSTISKRKLWKILTKKEEQEQPIFDFARRLDRADWLKGYLKWKKHLVFLVHHLISKVMEN